MPFPIVGKKYRLTPSKPPGALPLDLKIVEGGATTRMLGGDLRIPYYGGVFDAFAIGEWLVRCNGDGTYRGLNGDIEMEGTCVEIPPP